MNLPIVKKESYRTERLTLGITHEKDVGDIADLLMDAEVTRYFMVPTYETRGEYEALARKLVEFSQADDTKHLEVGVFLDGKLIGFVNDCGIEGDSIEIGYVISPACKGKGYATEAVKAVLGELREMGFKTVTAGYFEENPASGRVMEKCGMHPNGDVEIDEYRGVKYRCINCEINF